MLIHLDKERSFFWKANSFRTKCSFKVIFGSHSDVLNIIRWSKTCNLKLYYQTFSFLIMICFFWIVTPLWMRFVLTLRSSITGGSFSGKAASFYQTSIKKTWINCQRKFSSPQTVCSELSKKSRLLKKNKKNRRYDQRMKKTFSEENM